MPATSSKKIIRKVPDGATRGGRNTAQGTALAVSLVLAACGGSAGEATGDEAFETSAN